MNINLNLNDKVILIAEDYEVNYLYIKAVLEDTGAQILWAKDGAEAVEMCSNNNKIDLVLMDIQMPRLNGYEATRQIKKFRNNLPIIAQTAYAMEYDREKSLNAGCDDYISKPIRIDTLLEAINNQLIC
ncbi:MAG: response regulator [Bacteroidota bacterium]|nr:response regulator [Bacteroidota bacterium]MDP4225154.1 response regulator [Bacteroidota bacterium]MDP4273339.1 response regulator [Bacteroidota bacterium]